MATEYISRDAEKAKKVYSHERHEYVVPVAEIDWLPAADVVTRVEFNLILAENDDMREQLFARRLDGAFIVGDYAKAELLMDELPGKSANWKSGAKAKIRAHAAQDKGDKATALKEYGVFLEAMRADASDVSEIDPYTGVEWTKEMIVARNLKRMAGLAADIGKADEAAKLLAEAKEVFKAALEKAKDDPEMKAAIEKDAGDLIK